jgi:hypothetical protein
VQKVVPDKGTLNKYEVITNMYQTPHLTRQKGPQRRYKCTENVNKAQALIQWGHHTHNIVKHVGENTTKRTTMRKHLDTHSPCTHKTNKTVIISSV